ncbi:zeta toxin family protein [Sphingomonas zeae]|uniref:AAA family ATPase n=1 Tax=Sphingomonas zeae TaxID=1646122 RepID=A0A7Y6B1C4_9SPHN|nr:zeta toxin family protein [Sphingomonas zeae]MBB4050163.1 putative ABC-type ATPase [Sphingomonas zeae]NUU45624.1 AAA family ATPase [Sphingomonas zeae]
MTAGASARPQLWVVAGPNGAGKTTLVMQRLGRRALKDVFTIINPDVIAQELPRIDGRLDERMAGELAIRQRNGLIARRESLAIETTLSGSSTLRLMHAAREADYKLTLVYVGIDSPELSFERVRSRVGDGGHDVPPEAIVRRYPDSLSRLPAAMALAERCYVLDNSAKRRRLLIIREAGEVRWLDSDTPEWFKRAVPLELRRWSRPAFQRGAAQSKER